MKKLTRDQIRKAKVQMCRPIEVEEWGGTIFVKRLNPLEYAKFQGLVKADAPFHEYAMLFACDESGKPMFDESDREFLEEQPVEILEKVFFAGVDQLNKKREGDDPKN
jgi:hypothetical protein